MHLLLLVRSFIMIVFSYLIMCVLPDSSSEIQNTFQNTQFENSEKTVSFMSTEYNGYIKSHTQLAYLEHYPIRLLLVDMEDADYRQLLEIFYPIFFLLTISVQLMTLHLILRYTPKNMRILKYILTNTTFSHICAVTICSACQFRMITTEIPIMLRCYGITRYLEAYISYSLHEFLQFFVFASATSVVVTFYFKYFTMTGLKMNKFEFLKNFVIFHVPVFVSGVSGLTSRKTTLAPKVFVLRRLFEKLSENWTSIENPTHFQSVKAITCRVPWHIPYSTTFCHQKCVKNTPS